MVFTNRFRKNILMMEVTVASCGPLYFSIVDERWYRNRSSPRAVSRNLFTSLIANLTRYIDTNHAEHKLEHDGVSNEETSI